MNERANHGDGGSPLWLAEKRPEENRKAIEILKRHGAVSLAPKFKAEEEK